MTGQLVHCVLLTLQSTNVVGKGLQCTFQHYTKLTPPPSIRCLPFKTLTLKTSRRFLCDYHIKPLKVLWNQSNLTPTLCTFQCSFPAKVSLWNRMCKLQRIWEVKDDATELPYWNINNQ